MLLCYPRGDGNIYYSPYNGKQNWTRPLVVDPVCHVFLMLPGGDGRELIRHYKARSNMYTLPYGGTSRHGGDGRNMFDVAWR